MARIPEIDRTLDQGVKIPKTNSVNWDIPVNENWELLNLALKRKYDKDSPEEQINGVSQQSFELVEKSDVQNTANHIPRFTEEGHLLLPSGIEIW